MLCKEYPRCEVQVAFYWVEWHTVAVPARCRCYVFIRLQQRMALYVLDLIEQHELMSPRGLIRF